MDPGTQMIYVKNLNKYFMEKINIFMSMGAVKTIRRCELVDKHENIRCR